MTRRTDRSRPLMFVFVGLFSVVIHIPILLGAVHLFPPSEEPLNDSYTVEPIKLMEEDPLDDSDETQQIVSLDKPENNTEAPDKATVLDRYNQKTDGPETVRKRDGRRPGAKPQPIRPPRRRTQPKPPRQATRNVPVGDTTANQEGDNEELSASNIPNDNGQRERSGAADRTKNQRLTGRDDSTPTSEDVPFDESAPQGTSANGSKDGDEPQLPEEFDFSKMMPNMRNTLGEGGTGLKDYLEVPEGEKDILNRKETRYWAFFDRLRESVRRQWRPNQVYRRHDPRGQIYGVKDRLTIVQVTLNGNGALKEMYVSKPSGLAFLDDEAVRAFRSAQPFPNPPEGLKDENGNIKFAFGFMFEINSRSSRIIRYRR